MRTAVLLTALITLACGITHATTPAFAQPARERGRTDTDVPPPQPSFAEAGATAPPAEPPLLTRPLGSEQDAVYRGTGDRDLRGYRPGPLAVLQARDSLSGSDRFAIVVTRPHIELLRGDRVLRTIPRRTGGFTLTDVATAVDDPRWIEEVDAGTYLLKAALVHGAGTHLRIAGPDVSELRLSDRPDVFLGGTNGATAVIANTRVVGWDERAGTVDSDHELSRPFIIYGRRTRLDVLRSEIAYLGYDRGSAYGLSWREGNATGSVVDSDIHHLFFGMYSYRAADLELRDSRWHHCVYYGIDPHDYTSGMRIVGNESYANGSHGIIVSRYVTGAQITGNRSHDNTGNGIVVDAGSDDAKVIGNEVYDNAGDGVVVLGSSRTTVARNAITGNRVGIRVNLRALDNRIVDNTVAANRTGVQIYDGALGTELRDNRILRSAATGVVLEAGATSMHGDYVSDAAVGVAVLGIGLLRDVRIDAVDRGIEVRRTGILQAYDLEIDAAAAGVQLKPGADGELYDSDISAPEPIVGALRQQSDNTVDLPFAWLTAAGVVFLLLAIVLQLVHRARNRTGHLSAPPDGVTNAR